MLLLYLHRIEQCSVAMCVNGATTLGITTFSIMTLSIQGLNVTLFITLSINDTQHKNTANMISVIMQSVAFYSILWSVVMLNVVAPCERPTLQLSRKQCPIRACDTSLPNISVSFVSLIAQTNNLKSHQQELAFSPLKKPTPCPCLKIKLNAALKKCLVKSYVSRGQCYKTFLSVI